ncbi:hypothetical protein TNCT_78741 [Trichonephila clavata]|uniref:Uncharacterized protein n=1 Tax=Trichonephila clavata TaxID=2740835 RepID=A0A8X6HZ64_TRICU|nr:hypothetical protein TNCT_78741 [Trichonephila clavata]
MSYHPVFVGAPPAQVMTRIQYNTSNTIGMHFVCLVLYIGPYDHRLFIALTDYRDQRPLAEQTQSEALSQNSSEHTL